MSEQQSQSAAASSTTTEAKGELLDSIVAATPNAEKDRVVDWIKALTGATVDRYRSWDKTVGRTITKAIAAIDAEISKQLAAVMHHPEFQKLEGSWRGLNHLVMNSETGTQLDIRVMNVSKKELGKDLDAASEFDQSTLYKKIYESEFGTPGGKPYGMLIGDYEFTNHPDDIDVLSKVSQTAAAAFCPFISAASPKLLGLSSYEELNKPRDMKKIFASPDYIKWNAFRDSADSRFVSLVMPRVLARLPYGSETKPVEEFAYEEVPAGKQIPHDSYTWMNASYVYGAKITEAFSKYGWCTAIRGAEGGGLVEGLPVHVTTDEDGDKGIKCPSEVVIPDRREKELSDLGFIALCHYKGTEKAVFIGAQTCQRPKEYDQPNATANAKICARLPYIFASSRIAHFLKVIARDWVGSFIEKDELQERLRRWIANYTLKDDKPSQEMKARYPLADAEITVTEVPGSPGSYNAVAHLRPWLQMEELNASVRMVAKLPQPAK